MLTVSPYLQRKTACCQLSCADGQESCGYIIGYMYLNTCIVCDTCGNQHMKRDINIIKVYCKRSWACKPHWISLIDCGSTLMPSMKVIQLATGPIKGRTEIALEKEPKSLG